MIDRTEILRVASALGLEARVVEKDYVLGWLLHGIARDPLLGADSDEAARVIRACPAHRSNLMAPTILI